MAAAGIDGRIPKQFSGVACRPSPALLAEPGQPPAPGTDIGGVGDTPLYHPVRPRRQAACHPGGGAAMVFAVTPAKVFTHTKGDPFGATTHKF